MSFFFVALTANRIFNVGINSDSEGICCHQKFKIMPDLRHKLLFPANIWFLQFIMSWAWSMFGEIPLWCSSSCIQAIHLFGGKYWVHQRNKLLSYGWTAVLWWRLWLVVLTNHPSSWPWTNIYTRGLWGWHWWGWGCSSWHPLVMYYTTALSQWRVLVICLLVGGWSSVQIQ